MKCQFIYLFTFYCIWKNTVYMQCLFRFSEFSNTFQWYT